ncbi:hypothetical protein [Thermanaerothrix daxensis]|uniref:hypothetical protein n=1 Tax=Thermanaerothrix daxensis TaxID=869279 RepID=UPI0006C90298|nr:hypothetical protein [Thermanaerothrix daxensis]
MDLKRAIRKMFNKKQDIPFAVPAILGDKSGVVDAGNGYAYVQVDNTVLKVLNNRVAAQPFLPVWVGYDPAQPGLLQVLSPRTVAGENPRYNVPSHAKNHEYPFGTDILYMQLRQFLPLRITPLGGLRITIYPGLVWADGYKPVSGTFDLTEYCPLEVGKSCYVLITVDNSGDVVITKGSEVNLDTLSLTHLPSIPTGTAYVLGAVRLYAGQFSIQESGTDTDIVDLRFPIPHTHRGEEITDGVLSPERLPVFGPSQNGVVPAPGSISGKVLRDDGTWVSPSTGDMQKSVYDTNNNGVVDSAESVPWGGVTGKPSQFPPSAHTHSASDVTSGVFDTARIPDLDASKITTGTISTDRFSAYSDLQAESKIGQITGRIPTADDMRFSGYYRPANIEDFTTTIPSGWSWAGSPFVTPPSVLVSYGTYLNISGFTSASRVFFCRSAPSTFFAIVSICGMETGVNGNEVGLRVDDGTDNNYAELVWQYNDGIRLLARSRVGGGTPTETASATLFFLPPAPIVLYPSGSLWSDWQAVYTTNWAGRVCLPNSPSFTWTPSRIGITARATGTSWMRYYWDLFGWS